MSGTAKPSEATHLEMLRRIDQRRIHRIDVEWKVALGLWAGLAFSAQSIANASHVPDTTPATRRWVLLVAIALGAALTGLHFLYHRYFVRRANDGDLAQAKQLEESLGFDLAAKGARSFGVWSSVMQVGGTAALSAVVVGALMLRLGT